MHLVGFIISSKLSANLYDLYHCCVYSEKTPDDRQRNCTKHVEIHSKNKFEKLVHLVGFIIRKADRYVPRFVTNLLTNVLTLRSLN